jgi:hypothetical protein
MTSAKVPIGCAFGAAKAVFAQILLQGLLYPDVSCSSISLHTDWDE